VRVISRIISDRKGLSNVVVVMLSLVIVVIIVVNVVLWSYQMNQFDLERSHENVKFTNVVSVIGSSPRFPTQEEYTVAAGGRLSGTFASTQRIDGACESFFSAMVLDPEQNLSSYRLEINSSFPLDVSRYTLSNIQTVEVTVNYRANTTGGALYINAYNWSSSAFGNFSFNSTDPNPSTTEWNNYTVNLTDQWRSYVNDNGTIDLKISHTGSDPATVDFDFVAVSATANMAVFTFQNSGPDTVHLVDLWIDNSTLHQRYDVSLYVNSGETTSYSRADVSLPNGQYIVRIVTERGNIALYISS
jgi:hypothetical protein